MSESDYSTIHPGLIPNDIILASSLVAIIIFICYEVYVNKGMKRRKGHALHIQTKSKGKEYTITNEHPYLRSDFHSSTSTTTMIPSSRRYIPIPQPVYQGMPHNSPLVLDSITLCRYIPKKLSWYDKMDEHDSNDSLSISDETKENPPEERVIGLPNVPGCELNSPSVARLAKEYPLATKADLVRFLVARKGNLDAASEMYRKAALWHQQHLPLRSSPEIIRAMSTKCFFPHGVDRDGAPVIYFRGGLYDSTKASSEIYVLAAAHAIDWALRRSQHCAITCLVHASNVPGAPNEGTDVNFIKGFVQTLSDNFPERLKRLAIYPFPWYGRAIWSIVRVFVDKRTQDKVLLVPHSGKGLPPEILAIVDPSQIPECCGGTDARPVLDLESTLLPNTTDLSPGSPSIENKE